MEHDTKRNLNGNAKAYLTTTEAAQHVRLSARTLERFRVEGTGPTYYKAGDGKRAKVLYTLKNLDDWLTNLEFNSTSEYPDTG